ncbi:MAG: rod-binding protein [Alphaproteobacteria bacterium]
MDASIQGLGDIAAMEMTKPRKPTNYAQIDKASKEFESMFMTQMLQPMFDSMEVNPVFGGGNGERIMRSFLVQEYGKIASKNSHFGIADAVKAEMIRAQDAAQKTANPGVTHVSAN